MEEKEKIEENTQKRKKPATVKRTDSQFRKKRATGKNNVFSFFSLLNNVIVVHNEREVAAWTQLYVLYSENVMGVNGVLGK